MACTTLTLLLVLASVPKAKIVAAFGKRVFSGSPAGPSNRDATLEFAEETAESATSSGALPKFNRAHTSALIAGIVLVGFITAGVYWKDRWQPSTAATGGSLRIESDPAGAQVSLDGQPRGLTPLSLEMPAGTYTLTVQHGTGIKEMPVSVTDGAATVHHISWASLPAAPVEKTQMGHLSVGTDPAGSDVSVDGVTRGATPLTLRDLAVGAHRVVVRAHGTTYTRTVQIEAGTTATLFFRSNEAAETGSIAIQSKVPVQIFEDKRLIGTSQMDQIILPAGEHALEFVADSVGFSSSKTVFVSAGQTTAVPVELPKTAVSINALPWAEVFIDGARIGETPLGNLQQTLGPHEIVFRHPQLGERHMNVVLTTKDANRISIDMRQR